MNSGVGASRAGMALVFAAVAVHCGEDEPLRSMFAGDDAGIVNEVNSGDTNGTAAAGSGGRPPIHGTSGRDASDGSESGGAGATAGAGAAARCFSRSASRRLTSRSCSSDNSIDAAHRQQSATIK